MAISPLAIVETKHIGRGVTIHPFAVIGPQVMIGADVEVQAHAVVEGEVELGDECVSLSGHT